MKEEKEAEEGTRPIDSSDKIAGDQELQMLNSGAHDKLQKLNDKRRILQHKPLKLAE
jgi:hypothetical protein